MDDDILLACMRAVKENLEARVADEGFAAATVGASSIRLCDDGPLVELTSEEAAQRAKRFRAIGAFALRGAILCENHAATRSSVA
jgi:hypothetical protein